ncbi:MAG: ATP-binding protein [Actinomycetota bacterium]
MARAHEARTSLPADLASAGAARRFVGSTLREWECDTLADSALLLVSELVTNAVLHARSALDVVLRLAADRLRVEVHDESPTQPTRKHYSIHAGTGRGLMLVEQLAQEWGVDQLGDNGKRVWFELHRSGGTSDLVGEEVDLDAIERLLLGNAGDADAASPGGAPHDESGGGGPSTHRALLAGAAR